jgi:AcrR family transcriptional regulator
MSASSAAPGLTDGRRLRGAASRERIVRAMLELIREGDPTPSAEAVAERAGVGQRSVFRHFANMESLYQELNEVMSAEILPMAAEPFRSDAWPDRILEMAGRRAAIFERIMPFKLAADLHRHRSPFLAAQAAEMVRAQRRMVAAALPAAMQADGGALLESLDLLLSFDTWRRLRLDQGLSAARARTVVAALAKAAIEAAATT